MFQATGCACEEIDMAIGRPQSHRRKWSYRWPINMRRVRVDEAECFGEYSMWLFLRLWELISAHASDTRILSSIHTCAAFTSGFWFQMTLDIIQATEQLQSSRYLLVASFSVSNPSSMSILWIHDCFSLTIKAISWDLIIHAAQDLELGFKHKLSLCSVLYFVSRFVL